MKRALISSTLALAALMSAAPAQALTQAEVDAVVERLDVRQRNSGDYKALAYIEQKERV